MPALGLAAWAGGLAARWLPAGRSRRWSPLAGLGVARGDAGQPGAAGGGAGLRAPWPPERRCGRRRSADDPVAALAAAGAAVRGRAGGHLRPAADAGPVRRRGGAPRHGRARSPAGGATPRLRAPVLVLADESLGRRTRSARRVRATGRLGRPEPAGDPAGGRRLRVGRPGGRRRDPDLWWRGGGDGRGVAARRRSPTGRRTSGRSCRPWWSATTPGSTTSSPRTSAPPG